jgi:hypothetical protein
MDRAKSSFLEELLAAVGTKGGNSLIKNIDSNLCTQYELYRLQDIKL